MKIAYGILIAVLIAANVYLFAKGIVVSDTVQRLEIATEKLKIENSDLQTKLYKINSLSNMDLIATDLGFTKKAEPIFLNAPAFASR